MKNLCLNQNMKNSGLLLKTSTAFWSVGKGYKWASFKHFIKWLRISFTTNRESPWIFAIQQNTSIAQSKETTIETIGLLINGKKCYFKLAILHKRLKEGFQTFFRNWCYVSAQAITHLNTHCVKIVQIGSYFWSVFSCIRIEYGQK